MFIIVIVNTYSNKIAHYVGIVCVWQHLMIPNALYWWILWWRPKLWLNFTLITWNNKKN